jgi:hypothetical protein
MREDNPGLTDARAAAAAVGGVVAVPEFDEGRGEKDTDFNDMARVAGNGAVLDRVEKALAPGQNGYAKDAHPGIADQVNEAIKRGGKATDQPAETIDALLKIAKNPKARGSPAPSEDALALALAEKYCHVLNHVSLWGKWLRWNATGWEAEKTPAAYDLARKICRADHRPKEKVQ